MRPSLKSRKLVLFPFLAKYTVTTYAGHLETLDRLSEVIYQSLPEEGGQMLAWVAAQQVNARQKVEESIR